MAAVTNSCLYQGGVKHLRLLPRRHQFQYAVFMFYLDLDELDFLSEKLTLFSRNRSNWYSFHDSDYMPTSEAPLRQRIADFTAKNGVSLDTEGKVFLLTNLRVLGYIFNPISIYFCQDRHGTPQCAIAEVGNTFGEIKPFFIPVSSNSKETDSPVQFLRRVEKYFYVSPFSALDELFEFELDLPNSRLHIKINTEARSKPTQAGESPSGPNERRLLSHLWGERAVIDNAALWWTLVRYPLMTLRVIGLIHWQALQLFLKKIPYFSKEAHPELQRHLLRPHRSIINAASTYPVESTSIPNRGIDEPEGICQSIKRAPLPDTALINTENASRKIPTGELNE